MGQANKRDEEEKFKKQRFLGSTPKSYPTEPSKGLESILGKLESSVPFLTLQVTTVSMSDPQETAFGWCVWWGCQGIGTGVGEMKH